MTWDKLENLHVLYCCADRCQKFEACVVSTPQGVSLGAGGNVVN